MTCTASKGGLRFYLSQTFYQSCSNTKAFPLNTQWGLCICLCVCVCVSEGERQISGWAWLIHYGKQHSNVGPSFIFPVLTNACRYCSLLFLSVFFYWFYFCFSAFSVPPVWPFQGALLLRVKYVFTYHDKLKDLLKRANVIFILRALSIKLLSILLSLSATPVQCSKDINHEGLYLCGHCGSLQTAAWDTNRLSGCWISAFELLPWLKTAVQLCVN